MVVDIPFSVKRASLCPALQLVVGAPLVVNWFHNSARCDRLPDDGRPIGTIVTAVTMRSIAISIESIEPEMR